MTELGIGNAIYQLRKKIQELTYELDSLGENPSPEPELIENANLLRSNEFLTNAYEKQKELICAYSDYSKALEDMVSNIFEIQNDLKNLLKEQSKLLSYSSKKTQKSSKK